jgi:hypothetical protein
LTTMTTAVPEIIRLRLPKPHKAQRAITRDAARFNVVCCGRRFGKSTMGVERLIQPALAGKPVAWHAPTYRMLIPAWRDVRKLLAPITVRRSDQEHRIELMSGGVVEMWSLDDLDSSRGRAYARIVIDEAARVVRLEAAWTEVLRATLTDYQGDAWFLSTPRGLNYFHTLWQRGRDAENDEWASWQMPTSANPHIVPREIEAARRELPELAFAQEYLAQFIADSGAVFRRVQASATATPQDAPLSRHDYLVSVDWGKHQDFTVIIVWDATMREMVHIDRFQQIDYTLQLNRLQAVCERFKPAAIAPERNSIGDVLLEQIALQPWCPSIVLPFTTTNASKAQAVEAFALALEQSAVRILDEPVLVGELQSFAATRLPSGMLRYEAPQGMHDDTVMATIIGWHAISGAGVTTDTVVHDERVSISDY